MVMPPQTIPRFHGFLWEDGQLLDLNDLIVDDGWVIREANDINNAGWIVGSGERDGEVHAVLLRPPLIGETDADGDVDLDDFAFATNCMAGPNAPITSDCACADADGDGDVDFADIGVLQRVFAP
jgi:hypothetical protein